MFSDAALRQEEAGVGGLREGEEQAEAEVLPDKKGRSPLGDGTKEVTRKELHARDPFNLLT